MKGIVAMMSSDNDGYRKKIHWCLNRRDLSHTDAAEENRSYCSEIR